MKQLHGTTRPDRMPATTTSNSTARLLAHIPPPPATLASDERAAYVWLIVCEELHESGRLTRLVLPLIESYCLEMSNYFRLHQQAEVAGPVLEPRDDGGQIYKSIPNGYTVLKDRAYIKWQSAFKVLFPEGMAAVAVPVADEIDEFERLMNS